MCRHRWLGVVVAFLIAASARGQSHLEQDEATLRSHSLPTDGKGLVDFFQKRSLKDGDEKHLADLVKKLGSDVYREREPAAKELVSRGPVALPFLRSVLPTAPLEMKRRAEKCILDIEATMQAEPIGAAARVLAARKEPRGAEVLFNFLPAVASDPFLEEEVLACVGRLAITPEKVDPLLVNALKDPLSFRRMVAVYLIGRRAGPDLRQTLRDMLNDEDPRVRERVAEGFYGKRAAAAMQESAKSDEELLKKANVAVTEDGLLEFFRKRTLSDGDQAKYRALVKKMGHSAYVEREKAHKQLLQEGTRVLAFLKEVEYDDNVELSRRSRECLEAIRGANNPAVPIAAARLLTRPKNDKASPAEAIRTLLAYIPFVDDEAVEEEMLTCLTLLSIREPKVEPALAKALSDREPSRRAAAAYILGHVGAREHVATAKPLLSDANMVVRLRTGQGLLAARDKTAIPTLVNLLGKVEASYLPKVEETLFKVSNDAGPTETIHAGSPESRRKAAVAWDKWLKENDAKIDLAAVNERETYLGLITVAEYDNQQGNIQGQVWEGSRGGPKRFTITGVMGAMDAHTLPNGRVLIAENNANRVSERDSKGNIIWEYRTPANPICCQRLPNGNTFIASYNFVMEVRPDKTEVYRSTPGPQFYIFSAHKAKNGHIVAITAQGQIIEMEPPGPGNNALKTIRTVQTQTQGNWCSVEMLPNGNYLVAALSTNTVREITPGGNEVWSKNFPGVFRATRLPNGNVLVASMNTREVAEMDRAGTIRWRVNTTGRPWAVHYR